MKLKTATLQFDKQLAANGRSVRTSAAYLRDVGDFAGGPQSLLCDCYNALRYNSRWGSLLTSAAQNCIN